MSDSVPCPSTPHTVSPTSARSVSVGAVGVLWAIAPHRPAACTHCPWEDTQGSLTWCSSAPCRALGSALPAGPKGSRKGPYPAQHHPTRTASHEGWGHPGPHTGPGSDKGGTFPTIEERTSRPDPFRGPLLGRERVINNRRLHSMRDTPRLVCTPSQNPRSHDF